MAMGEEVDMQVRDALAGVRAVVHDEAEPFGELEFFGDRAGGEQEMAEEGLVGGVGLADAWDGLLRDDEQVDGRGGLDVVDDDAMFVLVLDARRNLAGDDFLEDGHLTGNGENGEWRRSACGLGNMVSWLLNFTVGRRS